MSDPQRPQPVAAHQRCAVCDAPIPIADLLLQQNNPKPVCRQFECQMWAKQLQGAHPHLIETQLRFHRQQIRDRREQQEQRRQQQQRIEMREAEENQALLENLLQQQPDLQADPPALLPLPQGLQTLTPIPPARRHAYRQHLQDSLAQALACSHADELPQDQHHEAREKDLRQQALFAREPALQQTSDDLCAICKGGCCPEGGDHGFISAFTLRRQLDNDPALTADDLLQRYLGSIPVESVEGACINQTVKGCALPREWRSDICNSYYCTPLRELQHQWMEQAPRRLFVVQRSRPFGHRFEADNPVTGTFLLNTAPSCD